MIRAARFRFMLYVTAVLTLVLFAAGAVVYTLISRQLDDAVDAELRAIAAPFGGAMAVRLPANASATAPPPAVPSDAFQLTIVGGREVSRSPQTPAGIPDADGVEAARLDGDDDIRTVEANGQRYRLLTRVATGPPGRGTAAISQTGLSLAARDRQQWMLRLGLAAGGGLGLLLTCAGAFFLAGRALAPVQLAVDRQRRFVSDASHEFRTPLALLRMEVERLDAGAEARPVLRQVGRLSRLVDDLLLQARLDEDALPLERETIPVEALLGRAADDARRLAPHANVSVQAAHGLWLSADADRLQQVLLILVDNAARATPPGGDITLRAAAHGREARITVADTGPGVPAEHAPRIFDRFYRVDRARSRAAGGAGGAGLGLSIARDIVHAHAGWLTLDNPGEPGATLSLRLPLAALPADAAQSAAIDAAAP